MKKLAVPAALAAGILITFGNIESACAATSTGIAFYYSDEYYGVTFTGSLKDADGDGYLTQDDGWEINILDNVSYEDKNEFGRWGTILVSVYNPILYEYATGETWSIEYSIKVSDLDPKQSYGIIGSMDFVDWYLTYGAGGGYTDFRSSEFYASGYVVPVPAGGWLMLGAIGFFGVMRRSYVKHS